MNSSAFDLAMEEFNKPSGKITPVSKEPIDNKVKNAPNDFLSSYSPFDIAQKMQETGDEGWWDSTLRNVTRTGSRMVETIFGLPGDLVQLTKFIGQKLPEPPQFLKQEPNPLQRSAANLLEKLPTSENLQQLSEDVSQGFTSPQGPWEERSDEVFKIVSSLLTGGGGGTVARGAKQLPRYGQQISKIGKYLGMGVAAESAKEGVKLFGGTEGQGEIAKLGSLFLLGLTLPRISGEINPENYLSSLYKKRDALIPQGTMVTPTGLEHNLQNFINRSLKYGGPTPEKAQVANVAEKFLSKISGQAVEMDEMLQMYRDINRNRAAVMAASDLDRAGARTARRYWGEMANMYNEAIEGYLGTINPEALNLHRMANSGWASLAQSKKASDFIMDKIRGVPLRTGVATLFGGGILYPAAIAKPLAGAAVGASAIKSGELAYRFLTNSTLRHYYNQAMLNALRENGPGTVRSIMQLDKQYQKELNDPKSNLNRPIEPILNQEKSPRVQLNPSIKESPYENSLSY